MAKKSRLLAQEPSKQAQLSELPAEEQYHGCSLGGFLAKAAILLLIYDSSSQVLLLPRH